MEERAKRVGQWIFRRRTWLPCVLIGALFIPHTWHRDLRLQLGIGLPLILLGESIRILSVAYAGRTTRTRDGKLSPLVIAGPYRLVRNPIYVGNLMIGAGVGSLFGRFVLLPPVLCVAALYYQSVVRWEESLLETVFAEQYQAYRSEVPRWIPRLSPGGRRSIHRFHLGEAIRSERGTLGMLCLAGLLCLALEILFAQGRCTSIPVQDTPLIADCRCWQGRALVFRQSTESDRAVARFSGTIS